MLSARVFFSSALLWILPAFASGAITTPAGGLRPDNASDLAPHPEISGTFNEFWTYLFWLNNGTQVEINLSRARFGNIKDPVCGAGLSVMGFRGQNYHVSREFKIENFSFDPVRNRLAVHDGIFFEGRPPLSHHVVFGTAKNKVSYFLDLSFKDMTPGAVWGNGVFHLADDQQVGLFFHIPRARVQGRLAINGDTMTVDGFGWMDHTWQTQFAPKLVDAGYRYVLPAAPERVEGGYFFQKDGAVFGYGVREDKGRLTLLRPTALKTSEQMSWAGVALPRVFEVDFYNGVPARCRWKDQRQTSSAFQEMNSMERFGAKLFLGGDLCGFRGTGVVNDSLPALFSVTVVKR